MRRLAAQRQERQHVSTGGPQGHAHGYEAGALRDFSHTPTIMWGSLVRSSERGGGGGGHPTQISERLGVPKSAPVRMAPTDKMTEALSVAPGSVTPFGIMSAGATAVRLLLDVKFKACERLIFHPFTNTKSTLIAPAGVCTHLAARSPPSPHFWARSLCCGSRATRSPHVGLGLCRRLGQIPVEHRQDTRVRGFLRRLVAGKGCVQVPPAPAALCVDVPAVDHAHARTCDG